MNRSLSIVLIAVLLTLVGFIQETAAQDKKYAQAGMNFLRIDGSARVAAMGGTSTGVTGSAAATFSNPAGLAQVQGLDMFSSAANWIAEMKHYTLGVAYGIPSIGVFGVNITSMDYGELQRTRPYTGFDPEKRNKGYFTDGTFNPQAYAVGLSYARNVANRFYVGGNVKYAKEDLGSAVIFDELRGENVETENTVGNIVFDLGTLYYTGWKDLRFGVSFRNFSNQSDYYDQRFELPLTFGFGTAMDLLSLTSEGKAADRSSRLTAAFDWMHPRDFQERYHVGLEYGLMESFFARGGYKFGYDEEGLTAGVGFDLGVENFSLEADYAYSAFGIFDQVHRVSVGIGVE